LRVAEEPVFGHVCQLERYVAFFLEALEQLIDCNMCRVGRRMGNDAYPVAEDSVEFFGLVHGAFEITAVPEAAHYIVATVLKHLHRVGRHGVGKKVAGCCRCLLCAYCERGQKNYTVDYIFHNG